MGKIKIKEEAVTLDIINEMLPLLELHRIEISAFSDMKINVDAEKYVAMYNLHIYKLFVARDETDSIVGYAGYYINNNMHYSDYVYATQDVIFVDKTERGAMLGSRIINYADKVLLEADVNVVCHHVKVKHDFGELLKRNGYNLIEKIYMKRLK